MTVLTPMTDEQIAKQALSCAKPINKIAEKLALTDDDLICYGKYKAKIDLASIKDKASKQGK